jgi:hydroxymethylbilane synthase
MKIKIGTRGSHLARTQSTTVANALAAQGHETELVIIRTAGDVSQAASFGSIGPQGVFVREIEQALIDGRIDVAVHSCKDLPTSSHEDLVIAAIPLRHDAADMLIANRRVSHHDGGSIPLTAGAVVGTSSARRQSWIKHLRPDLEFKPLRGNVPTRIGRLEEGYDAILLAAAGLERLATKLLGDDGPEIELGAYDVTRLDPRVFVPAPAQGALALQCRADANEVVTALAALDDPTSRACVMAERDVLERVEGGCDLAFGAYCRPIESGCEFVAMLERDGQLLRDIQHDDNPAALAASIWETIAAR